MKAILFYLFPTICLAQVATGSFDPSVFSINPAASSSRERSFVSTNIIYNSIEKTLTPQERFREIVVFDQWDLKTDIITSKTTGVLVYGPFVVEAFYAYQNAEKEKKATYRETSSTRSNTSENNMHNNQINLSLNLLSTLSVGLKLFRPSVNTSSVEVFNKTDAPTGVEEYTNDYDQTYTGIGIGTSLKLGRLTLAAGYLPVQYKYKFFSKSSSTYRGTTRSSEDSGQEKTEIIRRSYGVSYLLGDKKTKALRFELSQQKMPSLIEKLYGPSDETNQFVDGERNILTVEAKLSSLYGTFSVIQTKGDFIDFQKLLYYVITPEAISNTKSTSFTGSAGFITTKGHSFGIGFYYTTFDSLEKVNLSDSVKYDASTKDLSFSLSYSYIM